jgi:hypothetical protein
MKSLLPFFFLSVLLASHLKTRFSLRADDELFKTFLKDPKWSYASVCLEEKKSYSAMEKAPTNLVIETHRDINKPKFSLKPSLNFANLLNSFLGSIFQEDIKASISSFGVIIFAIQKI